MDIPDKILKKVKKKKHEPRFCTNTEGCVYKSYFGNKCITPKRVIWRTCRFKTKIQGEENGKS